MFGWVTTKLLGYVSGGLVVALALSSAWGGIGWNRAGHWKRAYQSEKAAYATFRTAIVDRTADALAAQQSLNAAYKEKTDEAARQSQADYDALQRRYAGLLRSQAGGGAGGGAGAAAQSDAPAVAQGLPAAPGGAEGPVCMTVDQAAGLAAYAVGAHDLAMDLVSRGIAEWAD